MGEAVPDAGKRPRLLTLTPWLTVSAVVGIAAALLFLYNGLRYSEETQREIRLIPYLRYDTREDFNYFYAAASMVRHGDQAELYPDPGEVTFYPRDPVFLEPRDDYANARLLARGNYYNPPALALLQSPLAALSFRDAYWLFTALSLAAFGGFLILVWRSGRGIVEMPLLLLGALAFKPVHETLMLGHTALFLLLVLTAGFLLLRADRQVLAGLALALLALKPQWGVLPALFLVVNGKWRAVAAMGVLGSAIFFLPFFYTGFDTFNDYQHFLRFSQDIDMRDAPHMFSWNGFLMRLDGSEVQDGMIVYFADAPPRALVYGLIALTALPLLVVWWSRDYLLGVAATVVAMLLVSTHSVWYDWAILAVAALFLVLRVPRMTRGQRLEMWVWLLAVTIAASQSIAAINGDDRHDITALDWHTVEFFSLTPVAFAGLLWMASLAVRERQLRLPFRRKPAPPPPAASLRLPGAVP